MAPGSGSKGRKSVTKTGTKLAIFLASFAQGVLISLSSFLLVVRLYELSVALHVIGLISALSVLYLAKPLVVPVIEHVSLLSKESSNRYLCWLFLSMIFGAFVSGSLAFADIDRLWSFFFLSALATAAVQVIDVSMHAYRLQLTTPENKSQLVGLNQTGFRLAFVLTNSIGLLVPQLCENGWEIVYVTLSGIILLCVFPLLFEENRSQCPKNARGKHRALPFHQTMRTSSNFE